MSRHLPAHVERKPASLRAFSFVVRQCLASVGSGNPQFSGGANK
jgi:hypothetical protein